LAENTQSVSTPIIQKIADFRDLILDENSRQNLTRLLEPRDFFEGHVRDSVELLNAGWMSYPAMDLGSGAGVPGLLCGILEPKEWILCESEIRKATFLADAVQKLGLGDQVEVFSGRAEEFLRKRRVETIVARAVGTVSKIYGWIGKCSTWNKLILFKGPKWEEEWQEFSNGKMARHLQVESILEYSVGLEGKVRRLVLLTRQK
jgi:16S rRNA (guanine527-N7)-methyltransferase